MVLETLSVGSIACGDGRLGSNGTGSAGSGGPAGTGGTAGTGGPGAAGGSGGSGGDPGPICATPANFYDSCAFGPQQSSLIGQVSAPVTVTQVDDVSADSPCSDSYMAVGVTRRFLLRGPAQEEWTVVLRIPELPADLIRVGDTLDFSANFFNGGGIVLARDSKIVAFAYSYSYFMAPYPPDLSAWGMTISDAGVIDCSDTVGECHRQGHRAHVTIGTTNGEVGRGQTAHIGGYSISLERYDFVQCFDPNQGISIAGFAIP